MTLEVVSTQRAQQQADNLDRKHASAFSAFLDDLAHNGCAALGYRLTGPVPISRICVCGEDGQPPPGLGDDLADLIIRVAKQRRPRR